MIIFKHKIIVIDFTDQVVIALIPIHSAITLLEDDSVLPQPPQFILGSLSGAYVRFHLIFQEKEKNLALRPLSVMTDQLQPSVQIVYIPVLKFHSTVLEVIGVYYAVGQFRQDIGIPERSTHKIRKTYANVLLSSGVDEKLITSQMGHTDIAVTRDIYYFNRDSREKNKLAISQAINF